MLKEAIKQLKIAFLMLIFITILTGLLYPLLVTGLAQLIFPWQANGSIIEQNGKQIASGLIGQSFTDPGYFWGRPSATSPFSYNGEASSGSNMGPSNPNFLMTVKERVENFKKFDLQDNRLIPVDLVTASGSGLDPEISPLAAFYQASRIAKVSHLPEQEIEALIQSQIKTRTFGILGEPRINVLQLNIALDNLRRGHDRATS